MNAAARRSVSPGANRAFVCHLEIAHHHMLSVADQDGILGRARDVNCAVEHRVHKLRKPPGSPACRVR